MLRYRFNLRDMSGTLPLDDLSRDTYPQIGESLVVFNFPTISRYVVEGMIKRIDWWEHDHLEPVAVQVRLAEILQSAAPQSNVVPFNADTHFPSRLTRIEKIARQTITEKLHLDICHADFMALCEVYGLEGDPSVFDLVAYHDIPVKVDEAGAEWNATTCFHGFSNDRHVLYVTLPGGRPFVMNPTMRETAKAFYCRFLTVDTALTRLVEAAVMAGARETDDLVAKLREMLTLISEGIMPIYDAAQEMTRIAVQSYKVARPVHAVLH